MNTLIRNPRVREGLGNFVLVFLSVGIVILYSSYQRPLWIDELQHLYYYRSPYAALLPILQGNADFISANAWLYIFINQLSIDIVGTSSTVLRLPSLMAGAALLAMSIWFIRLRGFSFRWQLLVVMGLGAQSFLMYFVGEARPYLPLAATVGAIAVYYSLPLPTRQRSIFATIGWSAMLIGVMNHGYFIGYLIALAIFFYFVAVYLGESQLNFRQFFTCANPWLVVTAVVVALLVRGVSATRVGPPDLFTREQQWDFIRPYGGLIRVWADNHLQFLPLPQSASPTILIAFAFASALVFAWSVRNTSLRPLLVALAYMWLALFLTLGLVLVSWVTGYQILNRQWVASLAMAPVAFTWICAEISRLLSGARWRWVVPAVFVCALLPITTMFAYRAQGKVGALRSYASQAVEYRQKWSSVSEQDLIAIEGDWEVANIRIYRGDRDWQP